MSVVHFKINNSGQYSLINLEHISCVKKNNDNVEICFQGGHSVFVSLTMTEVEVALKTAFDKVNNPNRNNELMDLAGLPKL